MPKTQANILATCLVIGAVCILRPAQVAAEVSSAQPTVTEKSPSEPNEGSLSATEPESSELTQQSPENSPSPAPAPANAPETPEPEESEGSQAVAPPAEPSQPNTLQGNEGEGSDETEQPPVEASQRAAEHADASALPPQEEIEGADAEELLTSIESNPRISWSLVSFGVRR